MRSSIHIIWLLWLTLLACASHHTEREIEAYALPMEARPFNALSGSDFNLLIEDLDLFQRESLILAEIKAGNIPTFLRILTPVKLEGNVGHQFYELTMFVTPDYLSIGSNSDHMLMPMTPMLAQRVAYLLDAVLPTRKMVDHIWESAGLKLSPQPIPPSDAMVTVEIYAQHNSMVSRKRSESLVEHPLGVLVGGDKKDLVITSRLQSMPDKVHIYGWHDLSGAPIQSLYSGHVNWYVDYSHGVRLVQEACLLNNEWTTISDLLKDQALHVLLSDESTPMAITGYDTSRSNYP